MAVDVGQVQLKDNMQETLGFIPGQLGGEFSKGGVSEINQALNGEVLSMEDFRRAEDSLEHAPETLHDIENADLSATTLIDKELEHTTFQYSQKETGREQNGGASDDDLATAIGRLKVGIQDASADKIKRDEKRNQQAYLTLARNQMTYADQLQAEMNRLLEEIDQLKDEITDLEKDTAIAEDLMANIDDLNSDDPSVRKSTINKTRSYLADHNIDLDDFKNKYGTYDEEAVHEALEQHVHENKEQIITKTDEVDNLNRELKNIKSELSSLSSTSKEQSQTMPLNDSIAKAPTYDEYDNIEDNAFDTAFDDISDSAFDTAFDDITDGDFDKAFDRTELSEINTQQSKIDLDQIAQLETFDTSSAVGSFAGTGENTTSVITSHFTAKADINQPNAEVTNDLQNNQTAPSIGINSLG